MSYPAHDSLHPGYFFIKVKRKVDKEPFLLRYNHEHIATARAKELAADPEFILVEYLGYIDKDWN